MNFWKPGRHLARGDRARDARDWEAAAASYERYLRRRPGDAAIWVQLGHMYKESGRLSAAATAYDQAAELIPDDADLQLSIGHLNKLAGYPRSASVAFRRALALDPNLDEARVELGIAEVDPAILDEPDRLIALERQVTNLRNRVVQLEQALAALLAGQSAKGS